MYTEIHSIYLKFKVKNNFVKTIRFAVFLVIWKSVSQQHLKFYFDHIQKVIIYFFSWGEYLIHKPFKDLVFAFLILFKYIPLKISF